MTETTKVMGPVWPTVYALATWTLIIYFVLLAAIHVVMTVLFYLGTLEQGFGYIFSFQQPAWLITLLDGSAAAMLWFGYRRGADTPWLGLVLMVAASVVIWGRADWTVWVPVLIVITLGGAVGRILIARRSPG